MANDLKFMGAEESIAASGINSGINGNVNDGTYVAPEANVEPERGPIGAPKALPSFLDEVMRAKAPRTLSSEGAEFLKTLKELLEEKKIKCEFLPETNCYLFHDNKSSIGFLFDEHLPIQRDATPRSKYVDNARIEANTKFERYPLSDVVLLTASDYNNVTKFEQYITRVLDYGFYSSDAFNIESISDSYLFRVITSKHVVDQVVSDMCVHGVLPYYQYGLVLEMNTDKNFEKSFKYNRPMSQDDNNWVPILVVPAYTTFITDGTASLQTLKFIPQIHISEPICMFPNIKMLPLVLSLAIQEFIFKGLWKDYFNKFDKSSPNIGSLWIDPNTNEPDFVSDVRARDAFIVNRCDYPILIMDIQNGRASIPCLPLLSYANNQNIFLSQFAEFFNDRSFFDHKCVTNLAFTEYTGVVSYEGKMIDSRTFDYFKILSSCKGQWDILDKFTSIPMQPDTKLNILSQIGFNVQSLYDTAMCLIEPNVLMSIASFVGARLRLLNSGDNRYQNIDFSTIGFTSKLMREGLNKANGNFFTANPVRPTFGNPFSNNAYVRYWGNNGIR